MPASSAARLLQARFQVAPDARGLFAFRLEASDDLRRWRPVGDEEQLVRLAHGGQTIERMAVELGNLHARFLRLRWSDPQHGAPLAKVEIDSVQEVGPVAPIEWSGALKPERCMGKKVEWTDIDFKGLIPGLVSRRFDVASSAIYITEERRRVVDFTDPYYPGGLVVLTKTSNTAIRQPSDLAGKKVSVQVGTKSANYLKAYYPQTALALVCAAALSAAAGWVVGLPALRVKGIYLGMATLSFGFIVEELFARWESVTGGNAGKHLAPPQVWGLSLESGTAFHFLCLGLTVVCTNIIHIMRIIGTIPAAHGFFTAF
ncbi:DUF3999 family protein [Verminephrobacter sp. Larva24]|nr:DUF3999 family protein [Verminephrobacter sp. Larva24]